jgi:formylglycine-generating enzyme required for sulfatase activity
LVFSVSLAAAQPPPPGMVAVPGGEFQFKVFNRWREGVALERFEIGPLGQFYVTDTKVRLAPFFIDRTEVTNEQFKKFLDASGYRPQFPDNFLRHWKNGTYPDGQGDHPVIWVDLDDAKAYAAWAGKSIPTEQQWQMAAQGTDGRLYPWGNDYDLTRANVFSDGPRPAGSYPRGASPYGCLDMVGNVWEWTDSKGDDGRHWFSYLRGGSWYLAPTSVWFTESGLFTNHQRLHFWWQSPGLNRTSTIGFRCVKQGM